MSRITNPQDHETAFLFGDGAGAAILTKGTGGHRLHRMGLGGDADQFAAIQRKGGGARMPWPVAADGHEANFYLQMNGTSVFKHAVVGFAEQIEQTLARENLKPEDIAWVVPHQANERILHHASERMGIAPEKVAMNLDRVGNTSSASIPLALADALDSGQLQEGAMVLMVGFGAGLTWGSVLVRWEPRS